MKIVVDADACPKNVLLLCQKLGSQYHVPVWTVASFNHSIVSDYHLVVGSASQEADIKIVNITEPGDLVVTQDWGLAAMVLGKQARVVSPAGREYNPDRIDFLLEERETKAKLRRGGGRTKGPKKRTAEDDQRFAECLQKMLIIKEGGRTMSLALRVYFDFCCPYCYLAWGFMKKVKESTDVADEWVTWEIHPDVRAAGDSIQNVVSDVNLAERRQNLNRLGEPVGLTPGDHTFVPNTRLALEAVQFATEAGKMHEWIDAVYRANFVEGKNIGDQTVLIAIAQKLGLDAEGLTTALNTGRYTQVLVDHDRECMEKKLEWVPTIYAGEQRVLEGALTYSVFRDTLQSFK
ncbi:DUF188 domain-containing protein [Anaerospora hongkongensis]|uniref:DUF188 domain-containing protein n=1 Tax=Anaerospora hongkongensis TaxID=244830 RepID=UPI002FD95CE5